MRVKKCYPKEDAHDEESIRESRRRGHMLVIRHLFSRFSRKSQLVAGVVDDVGRTDIHLSPNFSLIGRRRRRIDMVKFDDLVLV
ncbi:hypothetical protein L2E82_42849 [Cichorium intybus]|uniref:Uncharacterized protein n=1 Tax=Cichorium intybus TaxID=13427 RepID=A0ACB8ZN59_CICIN|nr:hypothetical protein L2E82_42849 [Cichorium intybus]